MPSMPFWSFTPRAPLAALAASVLLGACASVDLDQRYNPPPVRQPGALPPAAVSPTPMNTPVAQPSAVPATRPLPQALPPAGAAPADASQVQAANAHLVTLTTQLSGMSAVPATRSNGGGQLDMLYDANTRLLRWKTRWSGMHTPIVGVQFHGPAGDGQVAPATLIWPGPFGPTYEGRATLTPQQGQDLIDGLWYVNVQTREYPAGELRGQLRVVN